MFQGDFLYNWVTAVLNPLWIQAEAHAASQQGRILFDFGHDYDNRRLLFWNRNIYILV